MATYEEIADLFEDPILKEKSRVALIVAAQTIFDEDPGTTNHANRVIWARYVINNTEDGVGPAVRAILAANKDAPVSAIQSATDALVQSNIDAIVDFFADGSQVPTP